MTNAKKPINVSVSTPGQLEEYSGSKSREFTNGLLNATINTAWLHDLEDPEAKHLQAKITLDLLASFAPKDAIEGMLAAQAIAMHHGSMECFRRSMVPGQSWEVAARMRKDGGAKVASVNVVEFAAGLEAATAQADLGGSCSVSLVAAGLSISPMASTPM